MSCAAFLIVQSAMLIGAQEKDHRQCVIVVVGAPGTDEHGLEFGRWAEKWREATLEGGAKCVRLGPPEPSDGTEGTTDRARLKEVIASEAQRSEERLWLVLIGHGTFDGQLAKFNLRGPDVSATELAEWLQPIERPLALVNCASASGPFINRLSAPNRVIVTATKSGYEYNYARFGGYLAEAIAGQDIDIDKDDQVSLLEGFLAASARTAEYYATEARLATEHALIDDNGDGLGTPAEWFRGIRASRRARDGAALDGARANQCVLRRSSPDRRMPPALRQRRDKLELQVATLRDRKAELDAETYYARLETILLELARLYETAEGAETTPASTQRP